MRKNELIFTLIVSALISGCATTSNLPPPKVMEASNDIYSARATTNCDSEGCKMFDLVITNKSAKDIKIDWNKSQFVSNGQAKGGFWFEGIVIRDRNMPRAPEIIFAKGSYRKTIAPNASMELSLFPLAHWVVNPMPVGEFGIYVVIDVDGKEVPLKITTSGSQMESKSANSVTVAPPEQTDSKIGAQVQSKAEKLQELKRLHDAGLINSEVYSAQQKIILNN